ncbi:hypothetical protein F511_31005 [Dorcoceras hygrometricum]|uniref:Dystroglycan-like n=1 Tax=Dorcoceras hygrometricum TaxID=472368 RepID=A0A2Z7A9C0_9LAMI|nr:hypothetical protein F511_31005 [Dorcoceras hygrometricum]
MASSFYSNAQHVDFESILGMDDDGMVSMFEALMASGLRGFLGCPAVVYEDASVDFFENASVRSGVIISTVGGQLVEISEERFADYFELPVDGFGDLSEIPKDAIFDARSIVSLSGEPINLSGRKNQMKMPFRLLCDIMAKEISVKAGSFNAITVEKFSLITAVVCRIKMNWAKFLFSILKKMVSAGSKQAKGFAIQISLLLATFPSLELGESSEFPTSKVLTKKTVLRFVSINDRDGAEEVTGEAKKRFVSKKRPAADVGAAVPKKKRSFKKKSVSSMELVEVAEEAIPIQKVAEPLDVEEPRCSSADAVDLIIQQWTWFLQSLLSIPVNDKGKQILVEKDPVKGNPAAEHYSLICADIDLLVSLRAQVIDEVASFFHSFSLKKLATINFEEMYRKEEQVLSWGETESPQDAIQRKFYILLKYRTILVWKFLDAWRANFVPGQGSSAVGIQVIELLSDLYLSLLEELAKEARAHNLIWNKPCCSKIFEGSPRDRGAVIARTNSNTRSLCWIRKMILVDGLWTVELCADKWVKIPRKVISTEVPRQRQFDDTLPSMSVFFRLMKKRWADVCLEVTDFCASRRLLPVGSINFCRALEIVETDSCFASRQPTVFSLPLDRTAFRSVQINQSVVPSVQLSLDQRPYSPTSSSSSSSLRFDQTDIDATASSRPTISLDLSAVFADFQAALSEQMEHDKKSALSMMSSSSLRFDQTDIDATASSRPTISLDLSAVFADFQAALSEQMFAFQSEISSRMHKIEQSVCDSLRDQADIFRNLSQGARQEVRTIDDVHTIRFNEFRKNVLTQNASIFQGLADVRQVVEAVNAKVDIMASRLNAIQKDAEATKEALSN